MVIKTIKLKLAEWQQDSLIFLVDEVPPCAMRIDPFNNRTAIEIHVFDTKQSKKDNKPDAILRGIFCRSNLHDAPTIIFGMGQNQNAEDAKNYISPEIFNNFNLILVNYRGYGMGKLSNKEQKLRGSTGTPSAASLQKDILAVYDYAKETLKLDNFYAAGISLGSSIISYLSKHRKVEGQLLITPFDTMTNQVYDVITSEFGESNVTLDSVHNMLNHKFDSISNMKDNFTSTHIITAGADEYIKKERTDNLTKYISNLKSYVPIPHAQHNFANPDPFVMYALRCAIGTVLSGFMVDCLYRNKSKKA